MRISANQATTAITAAAMIGKGTSGGFSFISQASHSGDLPPGVGRTSTDEAEPDEGHAERDDDRRQVAEVDQRADRA